MCFWRQSLTCSQISTNKHRDGMGYASSKIEQRNTDGNRNVLFSSMEDACSLQETRALSPRKNLTNVVTLDRKWNHHSAWQLVPVLGVKCHSCGCPPAVGYSRVVFAILDIAENHSYEPLHKSPDHFHLGTLDVHPSRRRRRKIKEEEEK